MKMHKITLYVMDFDDIGVKDIETIIDQNRYLSLFRFLSETVDIGEWEDENPLNYNDTPIEQFEKYFIHGIEK